MFKHTLFASLALFITLASAAPVVPRQTTTGTGDATFYNPSLGACGVTNFGSDFVVAVSSGVFASFGPESNGNPICGRQMQVTGPSGNSVTVSVVDKCDNCNTNDIDLSSAPFDALADPSVGRIEVTWQIV